MSKYRVQAMSAKWPASAGSVRQPARARDLLNAVPPGNRLTPGQLGHGQESYATGQTTGVQKLFLAVAVVATTLVSAALMVLASVVFDLGY
jgi:hypothetical protein